ncbi:MAG: ABC transporter ATP-binding protein [Treponema sp.]|nr:ABC transporter ATP-binding protein [Treponema sp.]
MSLPEGEGSPSFRGDAGSIAVCFTDFTFQYRAQSLPTLYGINLAVRRGEKILIAGPSGCGKSTLAHCINGLIPYAYKGAVQGSLTIMGKDALKQDLFARSGTIGTVLQDTDGQFVGLTAAEDIAFAAENDCVAVAEMHRGAGEAAKLVHIEDHLNKSPQVLSGGQKQRVSLAGLLMNEVEILLFDEPLANLDPATGQEAIELIDRLHRDTGKTVIMVEHRLEDALHRPVDRIVVMEEGRIIADLPPAELLAKDILRKTGIREPLYLSALRYSGAVITAETRPESPETVSFDPLLLSDWERSLPEEAPEPVRTELLSVKSLSFRYPLTGAGGLNAPPALRDISFAIGSGDCVALAGKNGAGKSTLAKLICGFVRPDAGELRFKGKDLSLFSIRERAEHIGYVMQNPNQMISFPLIFDEAAFALRNRGMGENEIRDRVLESLRICGLYPFRSWPVSALSYGQKKRLTIASILVIRPELIILDEPTAGQDFRHYTEIMEFLGKLNREQGITLLIITHDMHLMLEYARRTLVVTEGKLLADAPPAEVLTEKALIEKANLKRTSLYDLALRAHFKNPRAFVGRFISFERSEREAGRSES